MQKYELFINQKSLHQLNQDIWSDGLVPAVLKIGNNRFKIGLTYRGNVIRKKKKKSYRIVFQNPLTVNGAHEFHLNAEYNDISLCRNKLSLDFFDQIGVISPHSNHVLLYINGVCKGIYLELESFDQYLLQKRNLLLGAIIYATNYHANFSLLTPDKKLKTRLDDGYTLKYGSKKDLKSLENFIAMINTLSNEKLEQEIHKVLDVDQYLKWLAGAVCTQNFDGFIHNYALYQNGETKIYEISPWDYDGTWGRDIHGDSLGHDFVPVTGYNTLTARLLHHAHFKQRYLDILTLILENEFTADNQKQRLDDLFGQVEPYLCLDPFIQTTKDTLEKEKEFILQFIQKRNQYIKEQIKQLQLQC